jgi:hypothetical protein
LELSGRSEARSSSDPGVFDLFSEFIIMYFVLFL